MQKLFTVLYLIMITGSVLSAQVAREVAPFKNWPAPIYWQPSAEEYRAAAERLDSFREAAADVTPLAATPVGSLVFVAMSPCRLFDSRNAAGTFGGPSLAAGLPSRTVPIQSLSSPCPVPSIAQAYSFNITVVPPGSTFPGNVNPSGALGFLTAGPTPISSTPNFSTLNSYLGAVVANAAIVPAGNSGSVDLYVSNNTDAIIDINGYYAPLSGITLTQGSAAAPSMSFSGDATTGIFSSGAGILNIATGGTTALSVNGTNVGIGTPAPAQKLDVAGNINASGTFIGDGSTLTNLNASNIATGTLGIARITTAARTRAITYLGGCDSCSALTNSDGQHMIYVDLIGGMTITSVTCYSDAGTPIVNIARNGTNILSSNLSCSTTGTASTTFSASQNVLNVNDTMDFVMVTADGVAKRVTVIIVATLN